MHLLDMATCGHVAMLAAALLVSRAHTAGVAPDIALPYHYGKSIGLSRPSLPVDSVRIKSTSGGAPSPVCSDDASCQALCPTADITSAQPPLSDAQAQQQVFTHFDTSPHARCISGGHSPRYMVQCEFAHALYNTVIRPLLSTPLLC